MEYTDNMAALIDKVIGAAIEVHKILGPGYLEGVYEEALVHELQLRNIPLERQKVININYKDKPVGEGRLDLLIDKCLVVELKAVNELADIHVAQVLSYLKTTGLQLGLLINFNTKYLCDGIKRVTKSK
ncbi:GxxExxY protein [Pelosinus sp. IPA-1]|uniref:GxxExxY protein n=1 Tax=Pelosinus sp. IPA-1 TaxID=3029569 RepID=UPI0024361CC2|nr:GxxExxY protein [Pelosinus sp. IPA-1]GMB01277.1 hypothetical protein PIPA1_40760 [Pelosinus sp. IPA-1]